MFSPDNFYSILNERYCDDATIHMITPETHGDKQIDQFLIFSKDVFESRSQHGHYSPGINQCLSRKIIMHDQEVFTDYFIDTYYQGPRWHRYLDEEKHTLKNLTLPQIIALHPMMRSFQWPIICHSDRNSKIIKKLTDYGFIDCYYWYHAMISMDWFRHWHWHDDCFPKDRSQVKHRFLVYALGKDGSRTYRQNLLSWLSQYQHCVLHNWGNRAGINGNASSIISPADARSSCIQIVPETWFETDTIHLTEKVFKPIVMSQPFLLLAAPHSLAYLKEYGFKTFGDFWDESYDRIGDHTQRLEMIKSQINELACMDQKKFTIMYRAMLPIIEHNRNWFYSQEFQNLCVNECFTNFEHAITQQKQRSFTDLGGPIVKLIDDIIARNHMIPHTLDEIMLHFVQLIRNWNTFDSLIKRYPWIRSYL